MCICYPLAELTRASEVDYFDGAALRVAQEDVLGLEVAVYDAELVGYEEHEGGAELLGELARQVERDALEVGVAQQVVQVVGEELEDETQVVAVHEVALELDNVGAQLVLVLIHELQEAHLDLRLLQERPLVLDDLDGDELVRLAVVGLDHLAERALADERVDVVAVEERLAALHYVVEVLVVVAVVEQAALLLVGRAAHGGGGRCRCGCCGGRVRRRLLLLLLMQLELLLLLLQLQLLMVRVLDECGCGGSSSGRS